MSDHKETALRLIADTTRPDRFDSEPLVHALLHVGDRLTAVEEQLADQNLELSAIVSALRGTASETPKLAATLAAPPPLRESEASEEEIVPPESEASTNGAQSGEYFLPGGRAYRPATNPEDWRLDAKTGEYVSPAGRRFKPTSHHVMGMLRKLQRKGLSVTLFDPNEPRPGKSN